MNLRFQNFTVHTRRPPSLLKADNCVFFFFVRHVGVSNASYIVGRAEHVLTEATLASCGTPCVAIVDPPRSGLRPWHLGSKGEVFFASVQIQV